jgi:phage recombination protein Bet
MSTALAIQPEQTGFTEQQMAALRALGVQNAPAGDVSLLFHHAARTGLDPFARQIYLINRGGKWGIQTAIDGFRVIRERKGTYRGQTEEWCGPDGQWHDVWLDEQPPAAAKVSVFVEGNLVPIVGIARWIEYAQQNSPTWKKMPALMLAKCAEALALRKAFPQDLSGIYTDDEMASAERETVTVQPSERLAEKARERGIQPKRQQLDVGKHYLDESMAAQNLDELRDIYREAKRGGDLDKSTPAGMTVGEAIDARREALEAEAELPPALDGLDEDGEPV